LFLAAVALVAIPGLSPMVSGGGDPTSLLRVGSMAASRPFIERDFDDPAMYQDYGHDGQQFYVMAESLPDLAGAVDDVDKLRYRARRILLPLLVQPLPAGLPTVYGFLAVNLVAVGAAAVGVGRLARRIDLSPWLGLSVAATPAMIDSVQGSLADALAFALAVWAVVVWRRHVWLAAGLLLLAGLSRETTLVVAVACAVVAPRDRRLILLSPIAAYGAWALAVSAWLPADPGRSDSFLGDALAQFAWPFEGWFEIGPATPEFMMGTALLLMSLAAAWVLRDRLPELSWWLLADLALLTIVNANVVLRPFNFARIAPLAVPAAVLAFASIVGPRASERVEIAGGSDEVPVGDSS
jgi:hypothetical protein